MASLLASRPSVGIIGGGISGLSTALSLERLGIACTVFDTGSVGPTKHHDYHLPSPPLQLPPLLLLLHYHYC